jgi:tetratricopeptide (TPR) repeat protein
VTAALAFTAAAPANDLPEIQKLLKSGQAAEALERADKALAAEPKDAQLRFVKGVALVELGRQNEAIAVFVKLADDHPELPEPYNNLAVLYAGQNQYDKARTALEMAVRTNPSYATAYENLGDVYAKLASQAYAKALQIDGGNAAVPPKLALIRELFMHRSRIGGTTQMAAAPKPPAASPLPAPSPPGSADPTEQAQAAVLAWAEAWSRKDLDTYFAAYARDFAGGKSRKAWEDERRARIAGKKSIVVKLSDLQVVVNGDKATARFRQDYAADAQKVSSRKTLDLARQGGKWVIVRESTGS